VKVKSHRTAVAVFIGVGPRTVEGVVVKIMSLPMPRITNRGVGFNNITAIPLTAQRAAFLHSEMKDTTLAQYRSCVSMLYASWDKILKF
jgi:hypothetical protein